MGGGTFSPTFENKIKGETLICYVYLVAHVFTVLHTGKKSLDWIFKISWPNWWPEKVE